MLQIVNAYIIVILIHMCTMTDRSTTNNNININKEILHNLNKCNKCHRMMGMQRVKKQRCFLLMFF